jgi:hypothetical protein
LKTKVILLSVCIMLLLAGAVLCAPPTYSNFRVERTDNGSVSGTWVYTLYNDNVYNDGDQPISLDSWGVFTNRDDNSASGMAGVDPVPDEWSLFTGDPVDPSSVFPDFAGNYPDDWQVTWVSTGLAPGSRQSVAGFTIQAPAGVSQPTRFEVIYYDYAPNVDDWQYVTGNIGGVPEPSTLASLAAAFPCLGIAAFRRRRSISSH